MSVLFFKTNRPTLILIPTGVHQTGALQELKRLAPNIFVLFSSRGTRGRVGEASILEGNISVNVAPRAPVCDNVFHLQLELPGDRSPNIPGATSLANYIQNVGRVGTTIWFPIPALFQKHPDGICDP